MVSDDDDLAAPGAGTGNTDRHGADVSAAPGETCPQGPGMDGAEPIRQGHLFRGIQGGKITVTDDFDHRFGHIIIIVSQKTCGDAAKTEIGEFTVINSGDFVPSISATVSGNSTDAPRENIIGNIFLKPALSSGTSPEVFFRTGKFLKKSFFCLEYPFFQTYIKSR